MPTANVRLLVTVLALGAIARAAEPPAAGTYPLKPVARQANAGNENIPNTGFQSVMLDKDGLGELPFATASGKVRVKVVKRQVMLDPSGDGKTEFINADLANGGIVVVPIKVAGKPFLYPLSFISYDRGDDGPGQVFCSSMAYLEADAGGTKVRLFDSNCNGRFGEASGAKAGDRCDTIQVGAKGEPKPLGKHLAVGDKLYLLQIVGDSEAIKLDPYTGPTAVLQIETKDGWNTTVSLNQPEGGFGTDAVSGTKSALLPGAYHLAQTIAGFGAKADASSRPNAPVMFYGWSEGEPTALQIKEGESKLAFGPPFKLDFKAVRSTADTDDVDVTDVALVGANGERYRAMNYGSTGKSTLDASVRAGGKQQKVSSLSYG